MMLCVYVYVLIERRKKVDITKLLVKKESA